MDPLDRCATFSEISNAVSSAARCVIAAPYFGEGAVDALGLAHSPELTIICDLFSGACNPYEIRKIIELPNSPKVLKLTGLHAKIYMTSDVLIMGSANPSANGLGFEGPELSGNIEACVKITDASLIEDWRKFVERQVLSNASLVTESDIRRAIPLWRRRRQKRTFAVMSSLLDTLRSKPNFFRDKRIFFWLYEAIDPNQHHYKMLETERSAPEDRELDMYCDWDDVKKDDIIIDFSYDRGDPHLEYGGIWRAVDGRIIKRAKSTIFLVKEEKTVDGMKFPRKEREELRTILETRYPLRDRPNWEKTAFSMSKIC